MITLQTDRSGEVGDDQDVREELVDKGPDGIADFDLVQGPGHRAIRQGEHLGLAGLAQEVLGKDDRFT